MENGDESTNVIFKLEEIFSFVNYNDCNMTMTSIQNQNTPNINESNASSYIRAIFIIGDKPKELIIKKLNCKKAFIIVKIKYKDNFMQILVNNQENITPNYILYKINSSNDIRGFIKVKLGIKQFPLSNYKLIESPQQSEDSVKFFQLIDSKEDSSNEYIYNSDQTQRIINSVLNNNSNNDSNSNNPIYNEQNIIQNNNNNNNNSQTNKVNNNMNNNIL